MKLIFYYLYCNTKIVTHIQNKLLYEKKADAQFY